MQSLEVDSCFACFCIEGLMWMEGDKISRRHVLRGWKGVKNAEESPPSLERCQPDFLCLQLHRFSSGSRFRDAAQEDCLRCRKELHFQEYGK
ncbi:hypothetical protein CDAR_315701 [Caerostris darwini]|uniref:Uncharacterized protein n=1 Tax=Caerostris darwini TaxID=1538125 RepID=A0AAV4PX18_9ARAC|nr:hypothetical protein CDAR_315701 [Caerostris darwini]